MGTRGLVGFKTKKGLTARYNHWDSYYSELGNDVVEMMLGGDVSCLFDLTKDNIEEYNDFLFDGLFCEYAYIYDDDNDMLLVFKGWFNKPQIKNHKGYDGKESDGTKKSWYCHLVCKIPNKKSSRAKWKKLLATQKKRYEDELADNVYWEREIFNEKITNQDLKILVGGK